MSTTSPTPAATNSTLRRMKARIRISPSSASLCTKASMCCRSSSITLPGFVARTRKRVRRPESVPTSPVNWPDPCTVTRVSTAPQGRTISSSPETTTKNGTALSPCSYEHFATLHRTHVRPRGVIRRICAGVNFGNICSIWALVSGSPSGCIVHRGRFCTTIVRYFFLTYSSDSQSRITRPQFSCEPSEDEQ